MKIVKKTFYCRIKNELGLKLKNIGFYFFILKVKQNYDEIFEEESLKAHFTKKKQVFIAESKFNNNKDNKITTSSTL
jgi:hypothetical protein